MTEFEVAGATDPVFGFQLGGDHVLVNTHPETACAGEHCVIHNPSDHHMRDWPMNWRADKGQMERICPCPPGEKGHGIGHPDPDDLAYHVRSGHGRSRVRRLL